jgi:hypothetical protein
MPGLRVIDSRALPVTPEASDDATVSFQHSGWTEGGEAGLEYLSPL